MRGLKARVDALTCLSRTRYHQRSPNILPILQAAKQHLHASPPLHYLDYYLPPASSPSPGGFDNAAKALKGLLAIPGYCKVSVVAAPTARDICCINLLKAAPLTTAARGGLQLRQLSGAYGRRICPRSNLAARSTRWLTCSYRWRGLRAVQSCSSATRPDWA